MATASNGDALLSLMGHVAVENTTSDLTLHVVGKLDRAFRDALALIDDPMQGMTLMIGVVSAAAKMAGGAAAAMLDLDPTEKGILDGSIAVLDLICVIASEEAEV